MRRGSLLNWSETSCDAQIGGIRRQIHRFGLAQRFVPCEPGRIEAVSAAGFALYEPACEPRLTYPAIMTLWFSKAFCGFWHVCEGRSHAEMARLSVSPPRGQRGMNICKVCELVTLVVVLSSTDAPSPSRKVVCGFGVLGFRRWLGLGVSVLCCLRPVCTPASRLRTTEAVTCPSEQRAPAAPAVTPSLENLPQNFRYFRTASPWPQQPCHYRHPHPPRRRRRL